MIDRPLRDPTGAVRVRRRPRDITCWLTYSTKEDYEWTLAEAIRLHGDKHDIHAGWTYQHPQLGCVEDRTKIVNGVRRDWERQFAMIETERRDQKGKRPAINLWEE